MSDRKRIKLDEEAVAEAEEAVAEADEKLVEDLRQLQSDLDKVAASCHCHCHRFCLTVRTDRVRVCTLGFLISMRCFARARALLQLAAEV
jgi:hypothetical protein